MTSTRKHGTFGHPALLATCAAVLLATMAAEGREIRTIYFPGAGKSLGKAFLVTPAKSVEIEFPQRNLSPGVKLPAGDLVMAALPAPPADGAEIPAGAPLVTIPAAWERCILIFLGDPENSVFPVRVIPVNASDANFPNGDTQIYNLSRSTLFGQFGAIRLQLKPGTSKTFGAPVRGFGPYPVAIDCIVAGENTPRAICRSTWQHDPEARQILFVVPQEGMEIPRVWGVLDQPEAKPKEEG